MQKEEVIDRIRKLPSDDREADSKTVDALNTVLTSAIEEHPEILNELKKFFKHQAVLVGFGVGMMDMSVISFGLFLQTFIHSTLAWLPLSIVMITGAGIMFGRLVDNPALDPNKRNRV